MANNQIKENTNEYLKLQIALSDESPGRLIELQRYINKQKIEGVVYAEMLQPTVKTGQMGIGINMNSIAATINVLEGSILELLNCLQKYVDNYTTNITVTTKEGIVIEITHGRSLKPEQLSSILKALK
ncbi:hypothetical protein ADIARSV_2440 [Arcticibacter svalbardensis MN12-7]|uniref:Uncharacterized protein n=1 Tax=Arcticibacter svalbardensis MN12-7 TaxID=1150600 RepID=R9GRN1_9SPHI|nr:hypothetical protein [Arcticibacter svalbardensis]EOR94358.1 hypothetical protein ADIARSV_2440 [Arcticibacter svalbardensis MN12-7]